jgi:hypothetical protein
MESFARAHDPRPRTLAQCILPDGGIDMEKYQTCIRYQAEKSRRRITALVAATYDEEKKSTKGHNKRFDFDVEEPCAKKSRTKRGVMARKSKGGELEILKPEDSSWYKMYVDNVLMLEDEHFQKKFRNRFRLPYKNYLDLVANCKEDEHFDRWKNPLRSSPIELLVLGALRYLGRGWTFDDLEESAAVSQEVHRVFFH